jgi:ribulose-phosphate 3-epimerase
MENKIIPTIFALDTDTFEKKLKSLEFVPDIHLDFMDGEFTSKSTVSFSSMKSISNYSEINFQVHLMAKNPIKYAKQISLLGIKTVLIQEEVFDTCDDLGNCIYQFKDLNIDVYIVLNPSTNFDRLKNFFNIIEGVMLMSVVPGAEGQPFIESTYDKVSNLRNMIEKNFVIQIDGGISSLNAEKLIKCGANNLCVGSYISSSETPFENYQKLLNLIK